jgi:hypothetical protein
VLLVAGYIPPIKHDFTQWWEEKEAVAAMLRAMNECRKQESLIFTILATGAQDAYGDLKPPLSTISFIRPAITLLYLVVAAPIFTADIDRRKRSVFGVVLLAALLATGAHIASMRAYFAWNYENSNCKENLLERGFDRVAEPVLKKFAADLDKGAKAISDDFWDVSVQAEGRALLYSYRFKKPFNLAAFPLFVSGREKDALQAHCLDAGWFLRTARGTETHIYYDFRGERLTSFSIGPADCPKW